MVSDLDTLTLKLFGGYMGVVSEVFSGLGSGALEGVGKLATSLREAIIGKEMTPELQVELQKKVMDLELAVTNAQMEMITAEAKSADPFTSRSRPMFLYVFYFILLLLGIVTPAIGIFYPNSMTTFFSNVALGFKAIPSDLYALFGAGYLGYVGARTWEKGKGVTK